MTRIFGALAFALLGACQGASEMSPRADSGSDALPGTDAAVESGDDTSFSPPHCNESIDAYCSRTPCEKSWADVLLYAPNPCRTLSGGTQGVHFEGCGYDIVEYLGADTGSTSYYDIATGQLVGVVGCSANTGTCTCLAGTPSFVAPASPGNSCPAPVCDGGTCLSGIGDPCGTTGSCMCAPRLACEGQPGRSTCQLSDGSALAEAAADH